MKAWSESPGPGAEPDSPLVPSGEPLLYFAGVEWDAVPGTDRQLVVALAKKRPVIWVDPARSLMQTLRSRQHVPAVSHPALGVTRISVDVPPGSARAGLQSLARWRLCRKVKRYVRQEGVVPAAVIASTTEPVLAGFSDVASVKVYFATDDFVAAAGLWGRSTQGLERARESNLASADLVLAVTPGLAQSLRRGTEVPVWFPNGADLGRYRAVETLAPSPDIQLRGPIAGLVGQVNERLDLSLLEAVVQAGISLLIVGPATFRDQVLSERFERLVSQANVQWVGYVPAERLPELLRGMDVGLTPYADTEFNRHSYPLKTVEYLAAGVPVVSTGFLPMNGLDPRFVTPADTPETFVAAVRASFENTVSCSEVRASVEALDWDRRADRLLELIAANLTGRVRTGGQSASSRGGGV